MKGEIDTAYQVARRAYELGRLRLSSIRALSITAAVAAVAALTVGRRGLVWLPITFLVWLFVEWRGAWLLRGGRRGLLAGLATLALPLSILRPCCRADVDMSTGSCCTMPGACVAVGALVGLSLTLLVPRAPGPHRFKTALGMALGVGSVVALRCGALFFGEAIGLIGGLMGGLIVANLARPWLDRMRASLSR